MNFIEVSKLISNGEKIFNIPFRVCFYARVSTDSEVQLNSLENQFNYYENYIKSKSNWIYVRGYIDQGISGVRTNKRQAFKKMIKDAEKGNFDLIITKEVSRFARDIEDSIHYIRLLKEANVGVFFENQNLNTFDSSSDLVLNILFNLAQDESRKLSERIKFGHREAIKKGHVLGSSNIIGYKKNKCKLVIVENEAKFIRKVYELYSTGDYGLYKLSKKLFELGFYNKKGNPYDKDTLKRIIGNPKYKGFYRGRTSETIDYRTKKRIKIDKEEQIIYKCNKNTIPPIVSETVWNKANEILKTRTKNSLSNDFYKGSLKYPFSSKIYCANHNVKYQRSHGNKRKNRPTWSCGLYLQYRLDSCASPIISEMDLNNILLKIMNDIIPNKNRLILDIINMYDNIDKDNYYELELNEIKNKIMILENKKNIALDLIASGKITKNDLIIQFENIKSKINELINNRKQILKQMDISLQKSNNKNKMIDLIKKEIHGDMLDSFIKTFLDEIIVSKINNDRYNIKLDIYLNLNNNQSKKLKGAKHINGNTDEDIVYLKNQKCFSIEKLRKDRKINKFTYNVYI